MSGSISQFEAYCRSFGFTEERKAAAWADLGKARIGPEDPEAIRVVLHHVLAADLARFADATGGLLNGAREAIGGAAKETVERVARSASKIEKASAERMAASQAELISSVGTEIAASADRALTKKVSVLSRNTLAAWLATSLLVCSGTAALGYSYGKSNATAAGNEVSAMLGREDGSAWRSVMAANDLQASLAAYCKPDSQRLRSVEGGTYCELPLWLARDGVVSPVPHQPFPGNAILMAAGNWLAAWGPWWLLGAGAMAVLLVRKVISAAVSFGLVRWLFDLPSRHPVREIVE